MRAQVNAVDLTVLLTVYRRKNLRAQLDALLSQSVAPRKIIVFQNGLSQKLPLSYLRKRGVDYVINSQNTGYFGRFAYLLNASTKYVAVMDDDIIPGPYCLENYLTQAEELDSVVGGNGRIARTSPHVDSLTQPPDAGIREKPVLVDFIGHFWLLEQKLLRDMFSIPPVTTSTGEDMHLCFSAKLRSGVSSFVAKQASLEESCDVRMNDLADDSFASFRTTPKSEREQVERYFAEMGLEFITPAEQQRWQ